MRPVLVLILLLGTVVTAFAQDVAFAFANRKGSELLTLDPDTGVLKPEDALRYRKAACQDGRIFDIQFVERQNSGPRDTGRALAANFDQYRGFLFRLERGRTTPDTNCLLAPASFFEDKTSLPLHFAAPQPACDDSTRTALAKQEDRPVTGCFEVAAIGDADRLLAVEYQSRGDNLLGALALSTAGKLLVHTYPANRGQTTWRVNDDGKWDPKSFHPVVALRQPDGVYFIALVWSGPEGGSMRVFRTQFGRFAERAIGYRYWQAK